MSTTDAPPVDLFLLYAKRLGETTWVAPPEYVIVRKLEFFREGGSEKHLRDIAAILRVSGELVRFDVVEQWTARGGLQAEWQRARGMP